jgi:hypothetical protein
MKGNKSIQSSIQLAQNEHISPNMNSVALHYFLLSNSRETDILLGIVLVVGIRSPLRVSATN